MSFYRESGLLLLGTRLKRLSDKFLTEMTSIYESQEVDFETSWFAIFYLLHLKKQLSLSEVAAELEVTQPAISQMISGLERKKLLIVESDKDDARKRVVRLSDQGNQIVMQLVPVWQAIKAGIESVFPSDTTGQVLVSILNRIEQELEANTIATHAIEQLKNNAEQELIIEKASGSNLTELNELIKSVPIPYTLEQDKPIWITRNAQSIKAFAQVDEQPDCLEILYLYTLPSFRRKGMARSMVEQLATHYDKAYFHLRQSNIDLIKVLSATKFSFKIR
ncbi:MAG: bifunctional helix-turn-helix transcriptional regulator/GNAT family N-acetyltransferase [Bacteroidota bacterium]